MKRLLIILFAIGMTAMSSTVMASMSKSRVRKEARFLTDKMSYELNMSVNQRNDTYEINYDFIYSVRDLMDYVLRGEEWAMDRYYQLLDIRNDDLRWVMSDMQYRRFLNVDYFYRPIYQSNSGWGFRVYISYPNINHFFFGRPYHYTSYHYNHYHTYYPTVSYYRNRYNHHHYVGLQSVRDNRVYVTNRRSDFGSVEIRPNTSKPRENVRTAPRKSTSGSLGISNDNGRNPSSSTSRPAARPANNNSTTSPTNNGITRPANSITRPTGNSSSTRPTTSTSRDDKNKTNSDNSVRPSGSSRPTGSSIPAGNSSSSSSVRPGSISSSSSSSSSRPSSSSVRDNSSSNSSKSSGSSVESSSSSSNRSSSSRSSVSSSSNRSSSNSSSVKSSSSSSSNNRSSSSSSGSSSRSSSGSSSSSGRSGSRR